MPYIKIHKVKEEIKYYNNYMSIYEAIQELNWILEHKCINCEQQCSDCYLRYKDKIAIEKIMSYMEKHKRKIKGAKTL